MEKNNITLGNGETNIITSSPQKSCDQSLTENEAIQAAQHCLMNTVCTDCDLCRYFCPDLCITKNQKTGQIEIDTDFCKGCGICAFICPKGAIQMIKES